MDQEIRIFSGRIYKVGLIRYVDVPADVSKQFTGTVHVPVCGSVEGLPLRTTLVSRGRGCYRLAIHGEIRRKLGVDSRAIVEVALQFDEESREPVLPPALVLALGNAPRSQAKFRAFTVAMRRQIVRYLTAVKQPATLDRRIATFIRRLENRPRPKRAGEPGPPKKPAGSKSSSIRPNRPRITRVPGRAISRTTKIPRSG